jgi:hypothetical protein
MGWVNVTIPPSLIPSVDEITVQVDGNEWPVSVTSNSTAVVISLSYPHNLRSIVINVQKTQSFFHPHTEFWFTWYDKLDTEICNIHFVNTGTSVATVTVYIAGSQATPTFAPYSDSVSAHIAAIF